MKEVYAEDIERFLEQLEAVASARVVANEDGRIDRIFVTTETERDDGSVRKSVMAGLMSRFGLHLEGWRVNVAHLAPAHEAPPTFHLFRLEETLSPDAVRVIV